ncbi:OpgC family protein [Derxia lacustris]|uniref:OpgC family protein n=1 Tax=Derxia lacustris TaxID=764842 RepID=UPI000A16DF3B|nr:OpgC domain-containing protein [Derxia lacustris]
MLPTASSAALIADPPVPPREPLRLDRVFPGRDPRLDFFRGLALWFIFLDHTPGNLFAWLTPRNYGFSDATEIFIFISGYSAAIAYGRAWQRKGLAFASAHAWQRAWTLYVAHLVLLMFYIAEVAWVATRYANPAYVDELNLNEFLKAPHIALVEALLLRFKPANLDVLPLYIVLLAAFPPMLALIGWRPRWLLALSAAVYAGARLFDWNLPAYPGDGGWFFNPFAWQLLFVLGAVCAAAPQALGGVLRWRPWLAWLAAGWLLFAFAVVMTWHVRALEDALPIWLGNLIYPVDKTNLGLTRLLHFLAIAYLASGLIGADARFLGRRRLRPILVCGRQSLYVFCFGIYLSFFMQFILVEIDGSLLAQALCSAVGIAAMCALAALIDWYGAAGGKRKPAAPRDARAPVGAPASGAAGDRSDDRQMRAVLDPGAAP